MMEGIVWETPLNPPKREDYFFKDGRRLVKPYFFEFICNVKNRWAGKTVVDLFAHEFRQRHRDYYVGAVEAGRIQVDGAHVNVTYTVKSSQRINHFVHRHEPPVMGCNISVLKKEDDLLTVWKPPSISVHPCGQYRKNTVLGILQAEHGLAPLFPVHRLDRLVSGLLILARSAARADLFRQQIEAGKVRKEYVAKVIGVFPEAEQVVDAAIIFDAREGRSSVEAANDDDASSQKGKLARTKFNRISTNGVHSIVKCEPITGRTHQIRVHLQHIGHPIANDSLYLSEAYSDFLVKPPNDSTSVGMGQPAKRSKSSLNDQISNQLSGRKELDVDEDFVIDPMCTNCPNWPPKGYEEHEEGLWLHCVRYSGPDWTYECPYPEWASIR